MFHCVFFYPDLLLQHWPNSFDFRFKVLAEMRLVFQADVGAVALSLPVHKDHHLNRYGMFFTLQHEMTAVVS